MRRKKKDFAVIFALINSSQDALMREYSDVTICIPEMEKWDYAIPENYTNYQDGFLFPNFDSYRGAPIIDHPRFGRLYLRWEVPYFSKKENESEKYLCFDRHGGKYTVIIEKAAEDIEVGNPSYFRFLPKVKKYTPRRKSRRD